MTMLRIENIKMREHQELHDDLHSIGFDYYDIPSEDGTNYWQEGAAYQFKMKQIDKIEDVSDELHQMCIDFADEVVRSGNYPIEYNFSDNVKSLIERSFNHSKKNGFNDSLYGRFDFAYDGKKIKLLEYNADTPTSLLESSIAQWQWLLNKKENGSLPQHADQFNSIHEGLVSQFEKIIELNPHMSNFHFAALDDFEDNKEDWGNIFYLIDVFKEVCQNKKYKIVSEAICMQDIGYKSETKEFINLNNHKIDHLFKLYPYEFLIHDEYFDVFYENYGKSNATTFVEPIWKMLLSNKCLLVELHKKYPRHPNLLVAQYEPFNKQHIKKARLAREGANNYISSRKGDSYDDKKIIFNDEYHQSGYIYQEYFKIPVHQGFTPVIGSWIVGNKCHGIAIREDFNVITSNDSHFVPHFILD